MKNLMMSNLRNLFFGVLMFQPFSHAGEVAEGTEVEVLKDIDFPSRMTGVWIQNGSVTGEEVNGYKSHCLLSNADNRYYNFETGINTPVFKGEVYRVTHLITDAWVLKNVTNNRELFLDCDRSELIYNRISDKLFNGYISYVGNNRNPSLKTIKKTVRGLLLIRD